MQLIDLSHTIEPEMPLFSPLAPPPSVIPWQSHAQAAASGRYEDCSCEISEVRFVTSIGTYLDSPFHFVPGGPDIGVLRLDQLVLPGMVVNCTASGARSPLDGDLFQGLDVAGKAVLLHTGWSRFWGRREYDRGPYLSEDGARALRDGGARLVGIDVLVIDDTQNRRRPAHVTLLRAGILIVENLVNLHRLPRQGFTFHAAPVKLAGAAAFPVRAYATLE